MKSTCEVLSRAYAEHFGIEYNEKGYYYDQIVGYAKSTSCIDYAHFDRDSWVINEDREYYYSAIPESGCEGAWIGIFVNIYEPSEHKYNTLRVGTIKTLDEGLDAWINMGALAGALAWIANHM